MLFDEPILFFKGLTIFRDFSNANQYYFLPPEAPRIARSAEDSTDFALRLVLFRPDPNAPPPQGMENGGGFLNLDVDLHVEEKLLEQVSEEIRKRFGGQANLVPVPFLRGSVELVLLGVGREDEGKPFVRKVAGSTVPSLFGSQRAAFSVVLDRDGAAIMRSVIEKGGLTMCLAIYHLTYAAIPPAYNLKITVNYERVFEHLDLRLNAGVTAGSGKSSFVAKAGFHMLMEELKEKRAIKVEEVDPVPGENGRTPVNQERIDEIIGNLMGSKWFKPTLATATQATDISSGAASAGSGTPASGTAPGATPAASQPAAAAAQRQNAQWHEDSRTPSAFPADRGVETFQPSTSGTRETIVVRGTGATAKAGAQPTALQPVTLDGNRIQLDVAEGATQHVEIKWPAAASGTPGERRPATWTQGATEGPTDQRSVERFQASASGTSETLVIRGEGATARVGSSPTSLQPATVTGNRLVVDVPANETRHVEITWPAGTGAEETFHLFFDYDRPTNAADVTGYNNRTPSPAEPAPAPQTPTGTAQGEQARYLPESRSATTTQRGPNGLDEWLGTLQPGSNLSLDAHASFENDDSASKQASNRDLSQRRLQVAQSLIGSRFPMPVAVSHGHTDSRAGTIATLSNDNAPANSRGGRPQHRVVLIKGRKRGGAQTIIRGQLHRDPPGTTSQAQPESTLTGHLDRGRGSGSGTGQDSTSVQASFEVNLEMIQREERIEATYELSTRKARTQEVHPQGQLILGVINPSDFIIEADGAIDFFQRLDVAAATTAQWDKEGIDSIHVQIRYAPREDGGFRRTGQIVLGKNTPTGTFKSGVLREKEGDIKSPVLYWYQYRVTVHYLPDVAMGDQSGAVTSAGVKGADKEGWLTSTERNLVIHPRDVTPAIMVTITTGIMRFDLLQRVQLALSYGPYRQNITLSQERPEHRLIIRPEPGLKDELLRTEGKLFYKDGAQVTLEKQTWSPQELIVINEPRENILRVQVILADPAKEYNKAIVRLRYEHGNRVVEQQLKEFTTHAQMEEWAVRLEDPTHREWKYMATLIKQSGDIDTIPWTEGSKSDQLIVGIRAVDVIPVQVTWLMPPTGKDAVKIDLRYEDTSNGVRWNRSELIREKHPGDFTWFIAIADMNKRSYQYRVTEFTSGSRKEGAWTETSDTMLVLPS